MCAVDARPFSMSDTPAFRWYLGGFSEAYVEKPMHGTTVDRHLDELCADVRAAITAKLTEQYESVKAMGWSGPWVSIQCDATSTNNSEYFTVSFSWVPPDFSGMERVTFCTKEFPGRHSANEIEPWLRQVKLCSLVFLAVIFLHFFFIFIAVILPALTALSLRPCAAINTQHAVACKTGCGFG